MKLFKRLKEGDLSAKEKLVNGNLKLVLSIIKRFSNKVDNLEMENLPTYAAIAKYFAHNSSPGKR